MSDISPENSKQDYSEVTDSYNLRIPKEIYDELNCILKSQFLNKIEKFMQHMSSLANKIAEKTVKLEKFKNFFSNIVQIGIIKRLL